MSKFTRVQKILIALIAFFVVFGGVTKSMQKGSLLAKAGYDGFTMLNYALFTRPAQLIQGWMSDFANLWNVQEENDDLRKELAKQKKYRLENERLKREMEELHTLLEMKDRKAQFSPISAKDVYKRQVLQMERLI